MHLVLHQQQRNVRLICLDALGTPGGITPNFAKSLYLTDFLLAHSYRQNPPSYPLSLARLFLTPLIRKTSSDPSHPQYRFSPPHTYKTYSYTFLVLRTFPPFPLSALVRLLSSSTVLVHCSPLITLLIVKLSYVMWCHISSLINHALTTCWSQNCF